MDEDQYKNIITILTNSIECGIPIEFLSEELSPNYLDINENNYFHYLSSYTFKEYCLDNETSSKEDLINKEKYDSSLNKYFEKIESFVKTLYEISHRIKKQNIFGQSPLELCLIKKNYYLAKEYIKYIDNIDYILDNSILNLIFNDNCIKDECIDFLIDIFISNSQKTTEQSKTAYFNRNLSYEENIPPLIAIMKQYNNNIYDKYKEIIKVNCVEYLQKNDKDEYMITPDENTKNKIIEKSKSDLNNFCINKFNILINGLIEENAQINYIEKYIKEKDITGFMYLMAYPCISEFDLFIDNNEIQINYQDYLGRTPLYHLINNKNNIIQISKDIYYKAFNTLINNKTIDLSKRDINGISPFLLCLINEYYDDAKEIYNKNSDDFLSEFNFDILLFFIFKNNKNQLDDNSLSNIKKKFNEINFDSIDNINERTLLHYYFMFISDINDKHIDDLNLLMNLVSERNKKDIFNRNCLFYLFIDFCGDPKKGEDPHEMLENCLKNKLFDISLNDKDIFDNNLLIYAIKCGFMKSVEILIKYGATLNDFDDKERNNIYLIALISNEELFFYLYDKKKIDISLEQKINIYESNFEYFLENPNNKNNSNNNININIISNQSSVKLSMDDFLNNPELIIKEGYNSDDIIMVDENELTNNTLMKKESKHEKKKEKIKKTEYEEFTVFDLLKEEQKNIINNYIMKNLDFKFENPLKELAFKVIDKNILDIKFILQNPKSLIQIIKNNNKCIFSDNLYNYVIENNKKEFLNKFLPDLTVIDLCKINIELNKIENLISNVNKIIDENKEDNKFINIKNKNEQNIIHILALVKEKNNEELIKIYDKIKNIKIGDLFDSYGNTPMYYACQNYNKKFIELFSNYKFNKDGIENVNTKIFIESKNSSTPLEELYKKINLEDNNLLDLIIEITFTEKIGYLKYVLDYLIDKYRINNKKDLFSQYKDNISNSNYLIRIIGLYQYLIYELKYSIMVEDENGNDPLMKCVLLNKYDFMFDELLFKNKENYIHIDRTNKEGKSLIHLIVESNIINKQQILLQLLKENFSFDIKDNKGFYPIDYAFFDQDKEVYDILKNQYLKKRQLPKINLLYNYHKDSDLLFNESIKNFIKNNKNDDLNGLVCEKYKKDNIHKVSVDNELIPYNAILLRGNLENCNDLSDKYILQIIENTNTKKYIVIFLDKDLNNEYEFDNFNEAEEKFKKIFKEETNNDWDIIKNDKTKFKTDIFNNYYYFDYDFSREINIYEYLKKEINKSIIKNEIKYNKNDNVRDLIYHLARKAFNNILYSDSIAVKEMIKNFKKKSIEESIYIFNQIEKLITNKIDCESDKKEKEYLLNCYLKLIPFSIHKMDYNIFNSIKELNEEKGRITSLYYIDNIFKILLGVIKNLNEIHPLDYIINSLGCNIIQLQEDNDEKKYLEKYVDYTCKFKIKNIFKINESINDIYFNPNNFEKKYIFYYGARVENLLNILSGGVKILSTQGKNLEKDYENGIYLGYTYSDSIKYCQDNIAYGNNMDIEEEKNEKMFIVLVEAALGENTIDYIQDENFLDNKDFYTTKDGFRIFIFDYFSSKIGSIVVKNPMNIRVKYIIELE